MGGFCSLVGWAICWGRGEPGKRGTNKQNNKGTWVWSSDRLLPTAQTRMCLLWSLLEGFEKERSKISYTLRKSVSQIVVHRLEGNMTGGRSEQEGKTRKQLLMPVREKFRRLYKRWTFCISFGRTHKYFIVLKAPLQTHLFLIINVWTSPWTTTLKESSYWASSCLDIPA